MLSRKRFLVYLHMLFALMTCLHIIYRTILRFFKLGLGIISIICYFLNISDVTLQEKQVRTMSLSVIVIFQLSVKFLRQ